jgi:hypothetical protein
MSSLSRKKVAKPSKVPSQASTTPKQKNNSVTQKTDSPVQLFELYGATAGGRRGCSKVRYHNTKNSKVKFAKSPK